MISRATDAATAKASQPVVSALDESDLPEAARIVRLAFGTFIGVPDPENFWNDRDYVYGRHHAAHVAAFGAKLDGQLVGSNFATRWKRRVLRPPHRASRAPGARCRPRFACQDDGAVRFLGNPARRPVHLRPERETHRPLSEVRLFRALPDRDHVGASLGATRNGGLVAFQPIERSAAARGAAFVPRRGRDALPGPRPHRGDRCDARATTRRHGLGGRRRRHCRLRGVSHWLRSEAGADNCFVKFGAVRGGLSAERDYFRLLDACEALAAAVGTPKVLAGANMARHEAYRHLVARGYRTEIQGVSMHKDNDPGYCRPGVYVLDDWR